MDNYLTEMDTKKLKFLNKTKRSLKLIDKEVYYYERLEFATDVKFNCRFYAVKVKRTTILLIDNTTKIKVHFSDDDIHDIIQNLKIKQHDFFKYLELYINKITSKKIKNQVSYEISGKNFVFKGIPFAKDFNNVICPNAADIKMNGNDLIGLLNLIIEKERTADHKKVVETCNFYMN